MRFQIHSDIHLEKYPQRRIPAIEQNCILAGDIGVPLFSSYRSFFRDVSRKFDKVIYVLGNHEYERIWIGIDKNNQELLKNKFDERNHLIRQILEEYKNIYLLDNNIMVINEKRIFGATLWTNYWQKEFRKTSKMLTGPEMFLSEQHKNTIEILEKNRPISNDLLITHFVSNREALVKPWSIGLGPSFSLKSYGSRFIFGHIHYAIEQPNTFCNPWGGGVKEGKNKGEEKGGCKMMTLQLD